ncbi:hypothetical protein ACVWYN_000001, partial [Pedobacter sp. UYP24]
LIIVHEKWPVDYRNDWPAIIRFRWPSITVIDNKPFDLLPFPPLALAATSPALVLSHIVSLLNSANEAKYYLNLPLAVIVLMLSHKRTKVTSCSWKRATR